MSLKDLTYEQHRKAETRQTKQAEKGGGATLLRAFYDQTGRVEVDQAECAIQV